MGLEQQGRVKQWIDSTGSAMSRDAVIYLAIVLYITMAGLAALFAGVWERFSVLVYPATTLLVIQVIAASACFIFSAYVLLIVKPAAPFSYVCMAIRRLVTSPAFFRALPLLAVFSLFFSAVSSFKTLIPVFQPFVWDSDFIALEYVLHGGKQPWEWLQPLLGYPWITLLINFVYNLWFFIMFLGVFWQLLDVRDECRRRTFLLSFVLIWAINGSLLAVYFSSAGPCFLDRLYPAESNPFAGLMTYLNTVNQSLPIWAIPTQDALWALYEDNQLSAGGGISAMPSMHVSVAWLLFLLVRKDAAWLRWLGRSFVVFILIGSVHLGWHYAIDGYLAIVTTTLIWWLVSKAVVARMRPGETTSKGIYSPQCDARKEGG